MSEGFAAGGALERTLPCMKPHVPRHEDLARERFPTLVADARIMIVAVLQTWEFCRETLGRSTAATGRGRHLLRKMTGEEVQRTLQERILVRVFFDRFVHLHSVVYWLQRDVHVLHFTHVLHVLHFTHVLYLFHFISEVKPD